MHTYRGWTSTKLHLALITMFLVTVVYALAGFPHDQFGTYCTAMAAAAATYSGAATAERFAARGQPADPLQDPPA